LKLPDRINDKPHYVFHPSRLVRRALHGVNGSPADDEISVVRLPWGLALGVNAGEAIGYTIQTAGVFDPAVTETLHRLIDPGDLVVDVGANVGYLTSLGAARAGAEGRVVAFEPHPTVYELLRSNAERWKATPGTAAVETRQMIVSDRAGTARLSSGPAFHLNMGLASVAADGDSTAENTIEVASVRLDDALDGVPVGVMKIDVEGHEPAVLRGAEQLLRSGAIRDIVFEDHERYPDPCTEIVEAAGYRLLSIENDLWGLRLIEPAERGLKSPWPGPSYLATRDPDRAIARLSPRGWQVDGIGPAAPWRRRRRSPS
jgi:FkbM family methyltransferase